MADAADTAARSRLLKGKLRVFPLVCRDEFHYRRLPAVDRGQYALEGGDDLLWVGDAFTVRTHCLGDLREPAGEPFYIILLQGDGKAAVVINGHRRIVEHNRENGDVTPDSRLDVEPDSAKRHIAHHVNDLLVRGGELCTHGEAQALAQLRRLTPA